MNVNRDFAVTEEVDGHRWGRFKASGFLGGQNWELCFNCGMIRRADKANKPCKGTPKIGPRVIPAATAGESEE